MLSRWGRVPPKYEPVEPELPLNAPSFLALARFLPAHSADEAGIDSLCGLPLPRRQSQGLALMGWLADPLPTPLITRSTPPSPAAC
jgi:hypothetical protein